MLIDVTMKTAELELWIRKFFCFLAQQPCSLELEQPAPVDQTLFKF